MLNGTLSIGHRPKIKNLKDYKKWGVTHIVTLLSEKEGALDIEKAVYENDLHWLWLPLENAQPPDRDRNDEILGIFKQWKTLLNDHASLYLHCSAGIHRTGMIAYAFLRYLGFNAPQAAQELEQMRLMTAQKAGFQRFAWGDQLAISQSKFPIDSKLDEFLQHNYAGCIFYAHSSSGCYHYRGKVERVYENAAVSLTHVETIYHDDYFDEKTDPFNISADWQPYMDFKYESEDLSDSDIEISSEILVIHYPHAGVLYIHKKPYNPMSFVRSQPL